MENSQLKKSLQEQLSDIRRHLHRYPELSGEEHATTASIRNWLETQEIRTDSYMLRTGLVAEVGTGEGPVIALRADIDALPIQEETGLPYASTVPGVMHACGHDFHTAALIGAAYLLKAREGELRGTVRLLFQPAEEKGAGAVQIVESGALEGTAAIFGLHNKPDLPTGTVGIKEGPIMAGADAFRIKVKGRSAHAAMPETGIDPVVAAAHIVTALQSVVSRGISSLHSAVISVTRISSSGTALNVIPDWALLEGSLRTFEPGVRKDVMNRIRETAEGVAAAFGSQASLEWRGGVDAVRNDSGLAELGREAAAAAGLKAIVPTPSPASEDFAVYQRLAPVLYVFMGVSGQRDWHHSEFNLDESALPGSASFLAALAERALLHFSHTFFKS